MTLKLLPFLVSADRHLCSYCDSWCSQWPTCINLSCYLFWFLLIVTQLLCWCSQWPSTIASGYLAKFLCC